MVCLEEFVLINKLPGFLVIHEQVIDPLMIVVEYLDVFLHHPRSYMNRYLRK